MRVQVLQQAPYRHLPAGFETRHDSVVTPPYDELVDPRLMHADLVHTIDELVHACRAGFDGVAISEHSQSSYDVMPNPNLVACAVAYATQGMDAAITLLGRSLGKSREPLKIAEEYAMLDVISGGRLIAGLPVGLSYDANRNGGIPPIETRARYTEGRALLQRAWSDPEPFQWNGKYARHNQVNIWPRPVQDPHPPIWIPGIGSPGTLRGVLERDECFAYLSWFGPKITGPRVFNRYWEMAEELGRDRNPYRLCFIQVVAVADTDAEAERLYAEHMENHFRAGLGAIPPISLGLPGYIDPRGLEHLMRDPGDLGLFPKMRTVTYSELIDEQVAIVGSPATVREQLTEFVKEYRIGNLMLMTQVGSMPTELARHNLDLLASDVLPHLREIWRDEEWENRWWPTGIPAAVPS